MQQEIEAEFLNIDHDEFRRKLKSLGAVQKKPMTLMRRAIMDYPDGRLQKNNDAWIRVRDEGDKVTLTYKTMKEGKFGGATEIEQIAEDFDKTIEIFKALGINLQAIQESKRETWQLGEAEIVLDIWPWLEPFIEIEAPSEDLVKSTAKNLGLGWRDPVFGTVITMYMMKYPGVKDGQRINEIPEIKFGQPHPDWFEAE